MNKKCSGCGAEFQIDRPELPGYVEASMLEKSTICRRCFRLKFYGDYIYVNKSNDEYESILNDISKTNDLVLYMIDIFNINDEILNIAHMLNNPMILVFTKRDLLPKSIREEKLFNYIKKYNLRVLDMICISSNSDYNVEKLHKMMMKYKNSDNVYIVGNTNAGKSSFINKMISGYSNSSSFITTSMLPSTTLNLMKIELNNKLTIIDTPGLIEEGNIVNIYDYMTLKKALPKKEIKPRTYQIEAQHSLLIENLVQIDYHEGNRNSFTLFISNELNIEHTRLKYDIKIYEYKKHSFDVNPGEDVVISGLGWIKITGKAKIDVILNEKIKVYVRQSII